MTQVNNQISSNYAKQVAASNKQSASNSKSGGGASAVKVASTKAGSNETTYYDIADQVKSIQSTAKQYGASVSGLSKTRYNTLAEAQKALNAYVAST